MVPAGSRRISRVLRYSGTASPRFPVPGTGLSPAAAALSRTFPYLPATLCRRPYNPAGASPRSRFGLMRVRSPLLAQSLLFSSPPGNEMFQFPGFAPHFVRCRSRLRRVAPFGHPRINGHLPLPAAFRSLSRPSSPPRAQASFMCPSLLSLFFRL